MDDRALLGEYLAHESEEAFAELVSRHVSKVYSVALRHTRNPHQAEEIAQAVFVILARKARQLGKGVILSGWLYQTAHLSAVTLLRSEIRRARREQAAHMQSLSTETESDIWPRITSLLDAAMAALLERDRDAIVLRFFDGKSLREVAADLGGSEGATKVRVNRALEKLRRFFNKRGVTVSGAVLAAAISANSVQAAPAGLAKSATAAALAQGASAQDSTLTLIDAALKLLGWAKVKTGILIAAVLLFSGTATSLLVKAAAVANPSKGQSQTSVGADRNTPRGTMLVMFNAIEAGDKATYVESFALRTSDELKLKPTLQAFIAATTKFIEALRERFGADAVHRVFPNLPFVPTRCWLPSGLAASTARPPYWTCWKHNGVPTTFIRATTTPSPKRLKL